MIRRFFKAAAAFFKNKCPECGKRIESTEGCGSCEKSKADSQTYSL